jgi:hypothetical protein
MTSGVDNQIRTAYELNSMSPEEIAEDQGFDVGAIKAKLMQISSKYRKDCGQESETEDRLNFTNSDLERVNETIIQLALGAEDEHLRFKAASYIRDDKKGRKEVVRNMAGNTFNILQFNEMMQHARVGASAVKERLLGQGSKVIET